MHYTITRRFEFDAAHRVLEHKSKCKFLHGHRYVALVTVTAPGLDGMSMVVDFGDVKKIIGDWINEYWDHNVILNIKDPLITVVGAQAKLQLEVFGLQRVYRLQANPTAEVLAAELYQKTYGQLSPPLTITRIRLYETPNCYADFCP